MDASSGQRTTGLETPWAFGVWIPTHGKQGAPLEGRSEPLLMVTRGCTAPLGLGDGSQFSTRTFHLWGTPSPWT